MDLAQEYGLDTAKKAILDAIEARYAKVKEREEEEAAEAALEEAAMMEHPEVLGADAGFLMLQQDRIQDCIVLVKSVWPFINQLDEDTGRCRTLLHWAAYKGEPDLCEAILDRHDFKSTDILDLDRATALHLATANRHVECCIAIVASGKCMNVNLQDMRDRTALHLAAVRGDGECYNAIVSHDGIDLGVRDYRNKLASEYAIEHDIVVDMPVIYRADERDLAIDDPDLQVDL